MIARWGRFVHRHRAAVLAASLALLVLTGAALAFPGKLKNTPAPAGAESTEAFELMQRELEGWDLMHSGFSLVFGSPTLVANESAFREALLGAVAPIRNDSRIAHITTPYDEGHAVHGLVSRTGHHALVLVELVPGLPDEEAAYREIRGAVRSDVLDVLAAENLAVHVGFMDILHRDLVVSELVSLPLVLVVLGVVFGTVVAAALPLGVGVLAVVGGLGGTFFLAHHADVSPYATNIVTLIGLGVAIDYSLFIVSRFREELRARGSVEDALARTMETAGRAVFFSGLTVIVGLLGLTFYSGLYFQSIGWAGAMVVAASLAYAMTLLPALLSLLGHRIDRLKVPGVRLHRASSGAWGRIARAIMARPTPVLAVAVVALVVAAVPFAGITMAMGGVEGMPEHAEARRGTELVQDEFPERGLNVYFVVVQFPGDPVTPERVGALWDRSRAIAALPGVTGVESLVDVHGNQSREHYQEMYAGGLAALDPALQAGLKRGIGEHVALLFVRSNLEDGTPGSRELLAALRDLGPVGDGRQLVAGGTAFDVDTIELVKERTPWAIAFVVATTFVLVMLQTGSVVLPLKAIAMNVLSIGASFGALVWIFQEGHLAGLLGFTPAPIDPSVPPLLFSIVFGLSMDYEVFMLSRMQEEYERTGDNAAAVAEGLEKTAGLITSAAAIMVIVFGAFAFAQITVIKAIGLGLALAVAVDASVVRALVVPSLMQLMGSANWWAPRGLKRISSAFREASP